MGSSDRYVIPRFTEQSQSVKVLNFMLTITGLGTPNYPAMLKLFMSMP